MNIISVKENPEYKDRAIQYFQSKWICIFVLTIQAIMKNMALPI
jgi:hypothetical protein